MNQDTDWKQNLEASLESLEMLTGLRTTLNDIYGFFCDKEGSSFIHPDRIYHRLDFCQSADRRKCLDHDCKKANAAAAGKNSPFIWPCWRGPLQIAIPLKWEGRHAGIIFLGPFRPASEKPKAPKNKSAGEDGLPFYDMENFARDSALFELVAIGIVEKTVAVKIHGKGERWEKIYRLYTSRHSEKIGINDVAKTLNLSPSRASHLVRELFGMPFEQVLLDYRLHRTAAMLNTTDHSLAEIAENVGFCDIYHLSKMFKRKFRIPPGKYRRKSAIRAKPR